MHDRHANHELRVHHVNRDRGRRDPDHHVMHEHHDALRHDAHPQLHHVAHQRR